jgi:hypothetical protein
MRELNDQIARLEIRSEQLCLRLHSIDKTTLEANYIRSDLLATLQALAALKGQRQRLKATYRANLLAKPRCGQQASDHVGAHLLWRQHERGLFAPGGSGSQSR